jgi:hypothetical protein
MYSVTGNVRIRIHPIRNRIWIQYFFQIRVLPSIQHYYPIYYNLHMKFFCYDRIVYILYIRIHIYIHIKICLLYKNSVLYTYICMLNLHKSR